MDPQEHPTKDLKKPNSLSPFSGGRSVVEKSFLGKQVPLQNRKIIKLACLLTNLVKTLQKTTHGSRSSSLSFARNISCLHFELANSWSRANVWQNTIHRWPSKIPSHDYSIIHLTFYIVIIGTIAGKISVSIPLISFLLFIDFSSLSSSLSPRFCPASSLPM